MIGINTAIYSRTGTNAGIGFAIPIDLAKAVMEQLKSHGKRGARMARRADSGSDSRSGPVVRAGQAQGALVANVEKDGPAAKAGISAAT